MFSRKVFALVLAALAVPSVVHAQSIGIFSWQPVTKVQEAMEKERKPAIFFFEGPDIAKESITWNFTQPQVQEVAAKFACAKVTLIDQKSSRPWGQFQKLADKYGVGVQTALVVVAYDGTVLASISQVVKRDELVVLLGKLVAANRERIGRNDEAARDLDQVEKWLGEGKYQDALRRLKMVSDKASKLDPKIGERVNSIEDKVKAIAAEKLAAAKRLVDEGRNVEARKALKSIADDFARLEEGKEAKELLKKVPAGKEKPQE